MHRRAPAGATAATEQDRIPSGGSAHRTDPGTDHRTVYAYSADPEVCVPGAELLAEVRAELQRHAQGWQQPVDGLVAEAGAWSEQAGERFRTLARQTDDEAGLAILVRGAVLGCAPLGLSAGAWLQWLSAPGNADEPLVLQVLALYAGDVGVGHPRASRGDAYLNLLRQLRAAENAVPTARLTADPRIADLAFRLPGLLLLMSRRPEDFQPYLLGADLCLRSVGLPPALSLVRQAMPDTVDWRALDLATGRGPDTLPALELSRSAVSGLLAKGGGEAGEAVGTGFRWTLAALRSWTDALYDDLRASLDPAHAMAELMRHRSREGSVYHHHFQLEGRSLADWLRECRTDPAPLLDALARSRLVKPGRSSRSPLVEGLVSERGPMFRVFSPDDLTVVRRWIDSLGDGSRSSVPPTPPAEPAHGRTESAHGRTETPDGGGRLAAALRTAAQAPGRTPADLREAYHLLTTRTDTPALRAWSSDYVESWLARCRFRLDAGAGPLPRYWTPDGLRPWLQNQHDRHGADFEHTAAEPLPSREAVVDDTLQTAPLTLIDGSWLAGFTDYEQASSEIGHSLFETYWDELGNGEPNLNHPLIYRQVLAEMGIQLPPTGSAEFTRDPRLREESFRLPVYWLAIGRFPRTYLPEILGLNLAMELSGVGGTYRRARLALKSFGFNTRFVDIHNTIDNVATGHSAWAADAVDTYLAELPDFPGPGSRAEAWNRVRAGYRSLNPPNSTGARLAARRAQAVRRTQAVRRWHR